MFELETEFEDVEEKISTEEGDDRRIGSEDEEEIMADDRGDLSTVVDKTADPDPETTGEDKREGSQATSRRAAVDNKNNFLFICIT